MKEYEVYDLTAADFEQDRDTLRQVRARELSIESAPVCSSWRSKMPPRLIGHPCRSLAGDRTSPGKTVNMGGRLVRLSKTNYAFGFGHAAIGRRISLMQRFYPNCCTRA